MPSQPYDLVKDDQDIRIPLHAEQAFYHGITFQAKLIGWQEVSRPSSRTEIVQAMRRIRYECKTQNTKKKKVTIRISVDGLRVSLKKKKRKKKQQQTSWLDPSADIELLNHPIYRIFYVSHDSSDLKIFSYIARDGSSDVFKCCVLKTNKKSQAMRIVRTVGQAFEVCHKLSIQNTTLDNPDDRSETPCDLSEQDRCSDRISDDDEPKKEPIPVTPEPQILRPNHLNLNTSPVQKKAPTFAQIIDENSSYNDHSTSREVEILRDQLNQQQLQTRQALTQLMLVREQLISETNARMEAQARTQQLFQQNRELLEHIASLGSYHEPDRPNLTAANMALAPQLSALFLQDATDLRKTFPQQQTVQSPNNNSHASPIPDYLSIGTLNHQLSTLQKQIGNLNQQQQNIQGYPHNNDNYATLNQLAQQKLGSPQLNQQELYQLNQDLLNRLQNLSFGAFNNNNNYLYANQNAKFSNINPYTGNNISNSNNNRNNNSTKNNVLSCNVDQYPGINKTSYSSSTLDDTSKRMSLEKSLDNIRIDDLKTSGPQFIKPLSQVGTMTTVDADGKVKVIVPVHKTPTNPDTVSPITSSAGGVEIYSATPTTKRNENKKNVVTLNVTDESGTVTNSKKLPATPSFITRSTSEKVPNRSQIMTQVQRTQWARHTTK